MKDIHLPYYLQLPKMKALDIKIKDRYIFKVLC